MNKVLRHIVLFALCPLATVAMAQNTNALGKGVDDVSLQFDPDKADTLDPHTYMTDEQILYFDSLFNDKPDSLKTAINRADFDTITNVIRYVLENRYYVSGDEFTKKWYDHLYLEASAGTEKFIGDNDSRHQFKHIPVLGLSLGKQFSPLHSARAMIGIGNSFERIENSRYITATLSGEYLFNVSTWLHGYDPTRTFEFSPFVGAGIGMVHWRNKKSLNLDVHAGVQAKLFTGPQGYLAIEPYAKVARDNSDRSLNWRCMNMLWGANVKFIYYLRNNLSKEARIKYLRAADYDRLFSDEATLSEIAALKNDSNIVDWTQWKLDNLKDKSWRAPFFIEVANGFNVMDIGNMGMSCAGHQMSISLGKWFSPAIGMRFGFTTNSSTDKTKKEEEIYSPYPHPEYKCEYLTTYSGFRFESMINPIAFTKYFDWDMPFGGYIVLGGEIGWIKRYNTSKILSCPSESYHAGVHLFGRLTQDLNFFVEPRFSLYSFTTRYSNAPINNHMLDRAFSLDFGFTLLMRSNSYRRLYQVAPEDYEFKGITAGLGFGTNFVQGISNYKGTSKGFNINAQAFAEYYFNEISGLRVSLDYSNFNANKKAQYYDYDLNNGSYQKGYDKVKTTGVWNRKYYLLMPSIDYTINLSELLTGHYPNRKFNLEAYAGPTLVVTLGEDSELSDLERHQVDHAYSLINKTKSKVTIGANAGFKATFHIDKQFSIFLSPTFYVLGKTTPTGFTFAHQKIKTMETLNVGLQYHIPNKE